MKLTIRVQLSVMMFLEFFIWGMWYVTMGTYLSTVLKANGLQIGAAYGMMAVATIISPFFIGVIADRFFAPKKLFALLHFFGGILLLIIARISDIGVFNWVLLFYSLLYAPTLALSSSIAFAQLKSMERSFAGIRVFGTIGWIIAGISIDKFFNIGPAGIGLTFTIAGVASLLLAAFSVFLPNTVAEIKASTGSLLSGFGSEAFSLLKHRSFTVFFLASALIAIPLSFYYSLTNQFLTETGVNNATSKMALGQFSEAIFILLIPFFMQRFGIKWMIITGMVAWMLRFVLFRYGDAGDNSWMLILAILLHGVCYDFFFVAGQIYTDTVADPKYRNAAQGMITMATYGLGMWIGSLISGFTAKRAAINLTQHHWDSIWIVPAIITVFVLVLFIAFFKTKRKAVVLLN